jgi:hypothetical protein
VLICIKFLSLYLSVFLHICVYIHLLLHFSTNSSNRNNWRVRAVHTIKKIKHLSILLAVCMSVLLATCLSVYFSTYRLVCQFIASLILGSYVIFVSLIVHFSAHLCLYPFVIISLNEFIKSQQLAS